MIFQQLNDIRIFGFKNLTQCSQLIHLVSSRQGGVSQKPHHSLNLGFHSGDPKNNVLKNRTLLAKATGIQLDTLTAGVQTHSGNVAVISKGEIGSGSISHEGGISDTDAMVTDIPRASLMVLVADCAPVFFFDKAKRVIGIAHSGRMGIVNNISKNTILVMKEAFGSRVEDILVGIGPCISKNYYDIDSVRAGEIMKSMGNTTNSINESHGKIMFDLSMAVKEQLLREGILASNIEEADMCTFQMEETFFSERRDGKPTGRFGAIIALR